MAEGHQAGFALSQGGDAPNTTCEGEGGTWTEHHYRNGKKKRAYIGIDYLYVNR